MEELHNVLYRRKGKGTTRKKDILNFTGFAYPDGEKDKAALLEAKEKDRERVGRLKNDIIHRIMDLMDVPRGSGGKEEKVARLVEFLAAPAPPA